MEEKLLPLELIDTLKAKYKNGDISIKLIFIIVGAFILYSLLDLLEIRIPFTLALPASIDGFLYSPWTLLTYAFRHDGIFHLLGNMVLLYFSGNLLLRSFKEKDLLTFFFIGILGGAIAFLLYSNYKAVGPLIGASAGVYSVLFAIVAYSPQLRLQLMFISLPVKIKDIGLVLLALDFLMILGNKNTGGHISHLGGAMAGYFYMKSFERGNDFFGAITSKILNILSGLNSFLLRNKKPKSESFSETNRKSESKKWERKSLKQEEIDRILDKISHSGYESLSKEEKAFLFSAGKDS